MNMPEGSHTEKRWYGFWPSLYFMEHASKSKAGLFLPFSDFDKKRAGTKDLWVILCTVNGADGPYPEERIVTYGPWITRAVDT